MKFRKEIPQFDKFTQEFFYQQLQAKTKSQMEIDLEKKLSKFEKFKKQQEDVIRKIQDFDEMKQKFEIEERVKQLKNEGARYRSFQIQFEQKGIDDWKQNMMRIKEIQKKDLDFQLKEAEKYRSMVYNSIKHSENDYHRKIDIFEKNLKLAPIESVSTNNVSKHSEEFSETKKFFKSVYELSSTLRETITQKIMNDQTTKKERNRRRRKIIVEQSKAQLEIENRRREEQYIQKLYKHSNQEKQITYETFRVMQIKNIIIEDRKLRDEMYTERRDMDIKFLEKNEEEFLKFHRENFQIELEKEAVRRRDLDIALKQKKRSNNTSMCKNIVDLIIDIAEEAYVFQQTNDSEEIDPRVWREWTQIFISNQSVKNKEVLPTLERDLNIADDADAFVDRPMSQQNSSKKKEDSMDNVLRDNLMSNFNTKYGNTFYSAYTIEPNYSMIDKTLDDCEFIDYVNYLGQWSRGLIPQSAYVMINVSEIMSDVNAVQEKVDPKAPKKPVQKKNEEEGFKEEDPENLIIPQEPLRNNYLGDLIDILVDIKYLEEESLNQYRNFCFNQVPIKLSLLGHDFAGKKTQAKILSENFPFKIYIIDNLLNNALELLDRLEKPLDFTTSEYTNSTYRSKQREELQSQRAADESKYSRIKDLARDIREILKNGRAITDDIYVDLLVEFIKIDFPEKSEDDLLDEIFKRVKEKEEILEELERNKEEKLKRPKAYSKLEQELTQKLMRISLEASKGFVIVNFPNTYNQAKLLEKKISSYVPESEKPLTQTTLLKESYGMILDKSEKILPPKKLIQGGLDFIFWLEVPPSECIRRAVGRRVLPLEIKQNNNLSTSNQFEMSRENFLAQTKQIYHLEDNSPPINSNICERIIKIDDLKNSEASLVTRHLSFDNCIDSIVDFYQPFGMEKQKINMFSKIDGNKFKDYVTNDLIDNLNKLVEINEQKEIEIVRKEEQSVSVINLTKTENAINNNSNNLNNLLSKDNLNSKEHNIISKEHIISKDNIIKENMSSDNNLLDNINNNPPIEEEDDELTIYNKKIEKIKSLLNKDLCEILCKMWSRLHENYVKECKSIFKFIRLQRDAIGINYNQICQKFIEFLKRPSKKQTILLDFQLKYNKFMDDYPDLIDDPQVKEEHHQEVDDLNDKIFETIENRKSEAIEERKKIMTAGWVENEMEKLYLNLERLYQSEIDKFVGSLHIIRDYYHNLDSKPLVELPFQTIDILKEEIVIYKNLYFT